MKETKETAPAKIKKERSAAYPAINIAEALDISKKFIDSYGKSPFSRENAVQALGLRPGGSSFTKVAALVHYGLLSRSGNAYVNSTLAERICYFQSEDDLKAATIEAVLTPKLFSALANEYSGRAIPGLLKNILITSHKINRNVADNVATVFKESLEHAGLYVNGIVSSVKDFVPAEENGSSSSPNSDTVKQLKIHTPAIAPRVAAPVSGMQSVTLPSGIVVSYPPEIAYLFALGKFGNQIEALDSAVSKALKAKNDEPTTTTE